MRESDAQVEHVHVNTHLARKKKEEKHTCNEKHTDTK